ncbi:unnamed protein product [Adineta steineri]|uniref:BED-type domain-containing protein n=1 Tax=Adineta steineri TaxID=433720 RepID=A0A816APM9_9BILA|nr:unnamed protein product [Adineta steineri]CAF1599683.1 unnamed protein product [Adineta steineri]
MNLRRRTIDPRSLISDNELSLDPLDSASSISPLTTTTATAAATTTTTATTTADLLTTPSNDVLLDVTLKASVWEHFERLIGVVPLTAKCSICEENLLTPNYGTSSLRRHLFQRHGLQQFGLNETPQPCVATHRLTRKEKENLDALAVDAIIQDGRAFGDFQKSGFKKYINALKPGYKPPTRNYIVKKLKRLHQQHTIYTVTEFEQADFLSVTCDFWTNRQQKSFLVITGHFIDKDFNEHCKVLKFITFEGRHFSKLIAEVIEKELISLGLFNKLITITCDGAANMRDMFNYFNRPHITYIRCIAHKLHLIICNSLNLWVKEKKNRTTTAMAETVEYDSSEDNDEDDLPIRLTQMIRSMSVDVDYISSENSLSKNGDDSSNEPQSENESTDISSDEDEWIDSDHDEEIIDNFIEGVNLQDVVLDDLQKQVKKVVHIAREIVNTSKRTAILSNFLEKKRINYNLQVPKDEHIKRRLSNDVKTRWNSSYKMLSTISMYRDLISDMFKNKGNIDLTNKQRKKLASIELTTDQWDLIKLLVTLLQPFYSATKVLSNNTYPTIGSALYLIRSLEENLVELESNLTLNALKAKVLEKFQYYLSKDTDQFNTLKMYGFFDPTGLAALTKVEQTSVEKQLTQIFKKSFVPTASSSTSSSGAAYTVPKSNNIDKAWEAFLKCTNKELEQEVTTATTTSIQDEFKRYKNLATKLYALKLLL